MNETRTRSTASTVRLWHCLSFRDPEAMMAWLRAVGFTEHATYRDDSGDVVHAEWVWPEGGGIMFGADTNGTVRNVGGSAAYLVTADPGGAFTRAVEAGAIVLQPLEEKDYGGSGGSVEDPEGNHWSFGTYQPGQDMT